MPIGLASYGIDGPLDHLLGWSARCTLGWSACTPRTVRLIALPGCHFGQAVAKYVEEAISEYSATNDRKLGNDMLARAAGPHVEVMEMLIAKGASTALGDAEGNAVDASVIVQTYRSLAKEKEASDAPAVGDGKDEL